MIIRTFLFLFFFLNGLCCAFDEDLQRSKAIALSRLHFYEIRGGLLTGADKISMDFQVAAY